ncbi:hypothetical protein JZ751_026881 [Albula glossodonta]|uniref:Uncharacterized protein n=1 Tax=Albula glossodonta TaxID=121402 RepID=A0A8T2PDA3_9TELE|nr:hypothetical protein JZ751_026881 [Albula glossodonta]
MEMEREIFAKETYGVTLHRLDRGLNSLRTMSISLLCFPTGSTTLLLTGSGGNVLGCKREQRADTGDWKRELRRGQGMELVPYYRAEVTTPIAISIMEAELSTL